MFLFHAGTTTTKSCVPFGTHWQLSRDSDVTARAVQLGGRIDVRLDIAGYGGGGLSVVSALS